MDRRAFINSAASLASLALVPSWGLFKQRREIDLTPFCAEYGVRYDIGKPFAQGGKVIATDGSILVRTVMADAPQLGDVRRLPNVSDLIAWNLSDRKWKPWPKQNYLAAAPGSCGDDGCYVCDAKGGHGNVRKCDFCKGNGYRTINDEYEAPCAKCKTGGWLFDVACDFCKGSGYTMAAAYQPIGDIFIGPRFDTMVRRLGELEFCMAGEGCIHFRGDGFDGLLMEKVRDPHRNH